MPRILFLAFLLTLAYAQDHTQRCYRNDGRCEAIHFCYTETTKANQEVKRGCDGDCGGLGRGCWDVTRAGGWEAELCCCECSQYCNAASNHLLSLLLLHIGLAFVN